MSILTIIQSVCTRIGLPSPLSALGSADQQIQQLVALSNEEGEELAERYGWSSLQNEAVFVTLAAELQGSIASIATNKFLYIINDTFWNRTQNRPMFGSLTPTDWQSLTSSNVAGPFQEYRIKGGNIYLKPSPPAGETCAFEYISGNWCQSATGTKQNAWASDTDIGILDENIMKAGLLWRWKQFKGLDYAEDFRKYEIRVDEAMGRDAGKPTLSMEGSPTNRAPGIVVTSGSWPL